MDILYMVVLILLFNQAEAKNDCQFLGGDTHGYPISPMCTGGAATGRIVLIDMHDTHDIDVLQCTCTAVVNSSGTASVSFSNLHDLGPKAECGSTINVQVSSGINLTHQCNVGGNISVTHEAVITIRLDKPRMTDSSYCLSLTMGDTSSTIAVNCSDDRMTTTTPKPTTTTTPTQTTITTTTTPKPTTTTTPKPTTTTTTLKPTTTTTPTQTTTTTTTTPKPTTTTTTSKPTTTTTPQPDTTTPTPVTTTLKPTTTTIPTTSTRATPAPPTQPPLPSPPVVTTTTSPPMTTTRLVQTTTASTAAPPTSTRQPTTTTREPTITPPTSTRQPTTTTREPTTTPPTSTRQPTTTIREPTTTPPTSTRQPTTTTREPTTTPPTSTRQPITTTGPLSTTTPRPTGPPITPSPTASVDKLQDNLKIIIPVVLGVFFLILLFVAAKLRCKGDNAQEVKPYTSPENGYHSQAFNKSKLHVYDATNQGYVQECELKENLHDNTVFVPTVLDQPAYNSDEPTNGRKGDIDSVNSSSEVAADDSLVSDPDMPLYALSTNIHAETT